MTSQRLTRDIATYAVEDIALATPPIPTWSIDFSQQSPASAGLSFSRASSAGFYDATGNWTIALSNTLRVACHPSTGLARGFLCEEARTNYLLNSASPATQTLSLATGSYILWLEGSGSCICAAGTAVGTGFGTATTSAPVAFTVTTAGSVTFTISGSVTRFQCENGTFATSFITTAGSAATRAADVCSMTLGSLTNGTEGTFLITTEIGYGMVLGLDNGSGGGSPRAHVRSVTNQLSFYMINQSNAVVLNSSYDTETTLGTRTHLALSYSPQGSCYAMNGKILQQIGTPSHNFPPTALRIGCRFLPGATGFHNAAIRKVAYYNKALPLATIQKLTN